MAGWNTYKHYFTDYKCTSARLGFSFPSEPAKACSTYDKAKLSAVLDVLGSVGVKVILTNQNGDAEQWYGSQAWVDGWKQIAADFKGDTRIKAFELCGEPFPEFLSPTGPTGGVTDMHSLDVALAYLIGQIRAIDPSRTIMYPVVVGFLTENPDAFYNDLVTTGVISKGNMLYDIVHPYYFEDYPKMDPVGNPSGDADWYWNSYCLPQIAHFGAANCWCGETFPWLSGYNGVVTVHPAYQQIFEIRMINYFCSVGMGFQMWCFFSGTIGHGSSAFADALTNSNYYTLIHS